MRLLRRGMSSEASSPCLSVDVGDACLLESFWFLFGLSDIVLQFPFDTLSSLCLSSLIPFPGADFQPATGGFAAFFCPNSAIEDLLLSIYFSLVFNRLPGVLMCAAILMVSLLIDSVLL